MSRAFCAMPSSGAGAIEHYPDCIRSRRHHPVVIVAANVELRAYGTIHSRDAIIWFTHNMATTDAARRLGGTS
ncbi:hypothetical protein [Sphingobium sp. SCG-1]|uniref:hypothetical protein n=1 Tax=Sphingobium sp. SCG-1 TaxID=2072936 RepID=UPI00166F994E|nr:hypothetical protein [Sphingobium sp. SCG-1]